MKLFINSNGTPQGTHVATGYGQRIEGVQSVTLEANVGNAFLVATIKVLIDPKNVTVNAPKEEVYYKDKPSSPDPKEEVPVPLAATNTHRCHVCKALVFHADTCPHNSKQPVVTQPLHCFWCGATPDEQGLTYHGDGCPQKPSYRTEVGDTIVLGSTQVSVDKVTVPAERYNIYKVPSTGDTVFVGKPVVTPVVAFKPCKHCEGKGYLSKKYTEEEWMRFQSHSYIHPHYPGTYTVVCKDCKGSGWL